MSKIKILVTILFIFVNIYGVKAFEYSKNYEDIVNNYISESKDPNWLNKKPKIASYKYFYTADEENPSYIEYKISCNLKKDCGFLIVNVNGDDVTVPIASTMGKTPSEALTTRGQENNTKMYYFGGFEQFSENQVTGEVKAINPIYDTEAQEIASTYRTAVDKEEVKSGLLKSKLSQYKSEAKEIVAENKTVGQNRDYVAPSTPADTFLTNSWILAEGCTGSLPCYNQYTLSNGCKSGCAASAWAIIYGYYDMNGYPLLIPGYPPKTLNNTIKNIIYNIREDMGTDCNGTTYGTSNNNNGILYARRVGYPNSSVSTGTSNISSNVKKEINAGRPIMLSNGTHAMVAYGYSSKNNNIVRINMGWGEKSKISGYYTSAIDYDLRNKLWYNNDEQNAIFLYRKIIIKQ